MVSSGCSLMRVADDPGGKPPMSYLAQGRATGQIAAKPPTVISRHRACSHRSIPLQTRSSAVLLSFGNISEDIASISIYISFKHDPEQPPVRTMSASAQSSTNANKATGSDAANSNQTSKEDQKPAATLEEDDEFEDFPVEGKSHQPFGDHFA
jgi:hypothetical protein